MPSLDPQEVHSFWSQYQDPTIYRVISFMEGVENWTMDGNPAIESGLKKLGDTLEDIGNIDLKLEKEMIELCAFLRTGRYLRLLMCFDMAYPGAAAKILMHAEEITKANTDLPGIFLRRNIVFERLRLISRVFGPDRFKLITKALEDG